MALTHNTATHMSTTVDTTIIVSGSKCGDRVLDNAVNSCLVHLTMLLVGVQRKAAVVKVYGGHLGLGRHLVGANTD